MTDILVRQALLDDTAAISALFRAPIGVWQRLDASGRVETVPYDALTIYERWLHGGPWMSVETAAIQLSRLLGNAGIALVASVGGRVAGFVEAYHGVEPNPYGDHVHVAHLVVDESVQGSGIESALFDGLAERAQALKARRITASRVGEMVSVPVPDGYSLRPLAHLRRFGLPARTGQIFYRATPHRNSDPAQIHGWYMPVGRFSSARQEWETLWPATWESIPEIRGQRAHRMHFSAAGQEAYICCQQQLYDPRSADIFCWSGKPLTNQLVSAIRDWAHREGYRHLALLVAEDTVKTLGPDAEPEGFAMEACEVVADPE